MIGGDLVECIRNQGYLIRFYSEHQVNEFLFLTIPFDIKFSFDYFFYIENILVTYVSLIRTRMSSYSVCTKTLSVNGSFDNIRIVTSAAIPEGCEFVYIDRKSDHFLKIISGYKAKRLDGLYKKEMNYRGVDDLNTTERLTSNKKGTRRGSFFYPRKVQF